jgi:hypothetical protein
MKQELVIDNNGAFGLIAGVDYVEESMDQSCPRYFRYVVKSMRKIVS